MRISKLRATLVVGAVVVSRLVGCSPSNGKDTRGDPIGQGAGTGRPDSSVGTGAFGNFGDGGNTFFGSGGESTGSGGAHGANSECGVAQRPEEIIVTHDATVTDTITTYSPVAIYIMQDRSSSMIGLLGDQNSWPNSLAAVTAFVNDPTTNGLDVGMAVFPPNPTPSTADQGDCTAGSDCGAPIAEIGPIPQNGPAIISAMNTAAPTLFPVGLTPTECALRGMINHCLEWTAKSGEKCVAVLVTDGAPTTCNLDAAALAQIVADGKSKGVLTFTIGLPGSNKAFLDDLAAKGGSNTSVDVSSGSAAFIAALNAIRGKVSHTDSHQVVTQTVISAPLPCQWKIPPPKDGQLFDPKKVNVTLTRSGGPPQDFGYVAEADCARASDAWYFDDPNNPKQVLVCPTTCDSLKVSAGAEIDVSFGCARKPAIIH